MKNRTGSKAVDYSLEDSSGKQHCLQELAGQWALLVFHRHLS